MADAFDFLDEYDITANLPDDFEESLASKKWTDRRDALQGVLDKITEHPKLAVKASYDTLLSQLKQVIEKDANINNQALAAKLLTGIANGLRTKFAPHAPSIYPALFEKFKEKKPQLREPLCECVDAFGKTINLEIIVDDLIAAMAKPNPSIKQQLDNFIFRQLVRFTTATHPKKFVKAVVPQLVKHAEDSDKDVRDAALLALGGIGRLTGDSILNNLIGPLSGDALKMAKVKEGKEKAQTEFDALAAASAPPAPSTPVATAKSNGDASPAPPTANSATSGASEPDPWEFLDPVDILPKLPENFNENLASKKWLERKEALESLLALAVDNPRLDPKVSYHEIVETLARVLGKDSNINVAAVAAKCITQLAKGLRQKFAPHIPTVSPVIFDKFKEKKIILRDPLVNTIDAIHATSNLDVICDDIVAAFGKPNPNVKIQTNLFLYRVFKVCNKDTAPKKSVKALTPLIVKCTAESDPEVREAAFSALGAIYKALGPKIFLPMLGELATDKMKMAQVDKFKDQALKESGIEVVSEMVQSIHKPAPEAVKTAPKIVKPPQPQPAEVEVEEEEEPLKPLAKSDEKPKRRSRHPSPVVTEEPKSPAGVLSASSNRALRVKEERLLKTLRWNFKTPDDEHINQLMSQFTVVAKPELVALLFSKDFKQHIKALELIQKQLSTDPAVLLSYDLLLRWATLRFFDTNPQSLNKTLEFLLDLLVNMEQEGYKFTDSDVAAFIPYVMLKIGDTKDVVRTLCRRVVSQSTVISSPDKIFPLLIDALNTKNSRQKAECLALCEHFLDIFSIGICSNPSQALKPIAACISERDSTARSNALNCMVAVWRKIGDRLYPMIGTLPAKEKAMLDERIKRMGREPAPVNDELRLTPLSRDQDASTLSLGNGDALEDTPKMSARSRSTSRNPRRNDTFNGNETMTIASDHNAANTTFDVPSRRTIPSNVPLRSLFAIDAKFYAPLPLPPPRYVPKYVRGLRKIELPPVLQTDNAIAMTLPRSDRSSARTRTGTNTTNVSGGSFSGDMMSDCIDKNLSLMGSDDAREVVSAAKELIYLFRDQANYTTYLINKAEIIAKTIAVQFSVIRTVHLAASASGDDTSQILRNLCNLATFFIHQKPALQRVTYASLKLLLSELLRYLTDERSCLVEDAASISRSVNVITVKLCETADINESIAACFALLEEYLCTGAPSKLIELLLKCIFKRSENLNDSDGYCAIQADRFLILVDGILMHFPKNTNNLTERVGDSIRLVVQRLLGAKGSEFESYLVVCSPQGELKPYLQQCIRKYNALSKKTSMAKKRSLAEIFELMQGGLNDSALSELYFYMESHPEEKTEFESLLSTFPLKSSVLYYFDEFRNQLKKGTPKSFHQLYMEVLAEAGHTQALAAGPNHKHTEGHLNISLPFSMPGKMTTSTPVRGASQFQPPPLTVTPISSKQIDFYKKRISEIKASSQK
uniref:TOG domain-containing protein n=1 Tax=Panagrellus redivivus TaxID=6233 RepID=A0A7E4UZT1_PANRE